MKKSRIFNAVTAVILSLAIVLGVMPCRTTKADDNSIISPDFDNKMSTSQLIALRDNLSSLILDRPTGGTDITYDDYQAIYKLIFSGEEKDYSHQKYGLCYYQRINNKWIAYDNVLFANRWVAEASNATRDESFSLEGSAPTHLINCSLDVISNDAGTYIYSKTIYRWIKYEKEGTYEIMDYYPGGDYSDRYYEIFIRYPDTTISGELYKVYGEREKDSYDNAERILWVSASSNKLLYDTFYTDTSASMFYYYEWDNPVLSESFFTPPGDVAFYDYRTYIPKTTPAPTLAPTPTPATTPNSNVTKSQLADMKKALAKVKTLPVNKPSKGKEITAKALDKLLAPVFAKNKTVASGKGNTYYTKDYSGEFEKVKGKWSVSSYAVITSWSQSSGKYPAYYSEYMSAQDDNPEQIEPLQCSLTKFDAKYTYNYWWIKSQKEGQLWKSPKSVSTSTGSRFNSKNTYKIYSDQKIDGQLCKVYSTENADGYEDFTWISTTTGKIVMNASYSEDGASQSITYFGNAGFVDKKASFFTPPKDVKFTEQKY